MVAGALSAAWRQGKVLVDSGSQQEPLLSHDFAAAVAGPPGPVVGAAAQADGSLLRLYSVPPVDISINGRPTRTRFRSANIAPYDCILGESWLYEHAAALDYKNNKLWTATKAGWQPLELNHVPSASALQRVPGWAAAQRQVAEAESVRRVSALLAPASAPTLCGPIMGAHQRRIARRHSGVAVVADVARVLPEDVELELGEVAGLVPEERTSFSFVEADVRRSLRHLPPDLLQQVVGRLQGYEHDVFESRTMPRAPPHRKLDLDITLRDDEPCYKRPYPVAAHHMAELDRQIAVLLKAGIIRHSVSAYGAPTLFAPKANGALRLCVDYRALNAKTVRDRFPTPTAGDLIARTRGSHFFSKVDLQSGFHQLRVREEDIHKTAFVTPSGHYEWVTAPFGLTATPSAFQRLMSFVLAEHISAGYCVCYCDDVCIFSQSSDPLDHLAKVELVLNSLREHQLLAKGSKCEFFKRQVEFLGFLVSSEGVAPVPGKVEAIRQVPAPETVSQLRSFLGMANFFRSHLPSFSEISAPLTDLLRNTRSGRQRLVWSLECAEAFAHVKALLTSAPLLRHFDPGLRTAVHVDASQHAVGAVLLQWSEGEQEPRPVCFFSRKLQGAQFHYDGRNAESLAIQLALAAWRPLLYGVPFELHSDHFSLASLLTQRAAPSQRILRLCEFLADFHFTEIRHVKGVDNVVPDFLSRPWDAEQPDVNLLHLLTHPRVPKVASLQSLRQSSPMVVVMPSCDVGVGAYLTGGEYHLPSAPLGPDCVPENVARRLWAEVAPGSLMEPCLVAECDGVALYRVECAATELPATGGLRWRPMEALGCGAWWRRAHFDCLPFFGVSAQGGACPELLPLGTFRPLPLMPMSATSELASEFLSSIRAAQAQDPFLASVIEGVALSDDAWWRDFFFVGEGDLKVLCYQRAGDPGPRVCVPRDCRGMVLRAAHGGVLSGHPGVNRTASVVARSYYWPHLYADVAHFVRTCKACIGAKSSSQARLGVESFSTVPDQPFTHWAMDLIGPMPKSKAGNDLIVTWVDRTSKTIVAEAIRSGKSSGRDLAALTMRHICSRYGLPLKLTHDNDVRFRALWKELWALLGTKIKCTSAYNPAADPAERANRQVLEALRAAVYTVRDFDAWDEALPHICFGLNTHPSLATHMSAFEHAHGFPARVPLTLDLPATAGRGVAGAPEVSEVALKVQNRLRAAGDQAAAAQVRIGRILDRRSRAADVKVGDWVWLDGAHNSVAGTQMPAKLAERWYGPYPVLEVRGAAVRLQLPAELGDMSDMVNIRRLRFAETRDVAFADDQDVVPEPIADASGAQRWEVRRLCGDRVHQRRPEILVEWAGLDRSYLKWVHRDVLVDDVPDLVKAYEANPSAFRARPSAPKRATTGRQMPVVRASLARAAKRRTP